MPVKTMLQERAKDVVFIVNIVRKSFLDDFAGDLPSSLDPLQQSAAKIQEIVTPMILPIPLASLAEGRIRLT